MSNPLDATCGYDEASDDAAEVTPQSDGFGFDEGTNA